MISFDVSGVASPKGSNRAIVRGGRAVFVPGGSDTNKKALQAWASAVSVEAQLVLYGRPMPAFTDCPVRIVIHFRLPRPRSHYTKAGALRTGVLERPTVKPDVDKLARATLDALSQVLFSDDSQVTDLRATKEYAMPGQEGARIDVSQAEDKL